MKEIASHNQVFPLSRRYPPNNDALTLRGHLENHSPRNVAMVGHIELVETLALELNDDTLH